MQSEFYRQFPTMLDALSEQAWAVLPNAVAKDLCEALAQDLERHQSAGDFREAAIGRGESKTSLKSVRSDSIRWLDESDSEASIQAWLSLTSELRNILNQNFFLSLNAYEGHFACYEPGAFYQKHIDRFRDNPERKISLLLFLNRDWKAEDEGELVIYDPEDSEKILAEIKPEMGTVVLFVSDKILHEVRVTNRRRLSIAGWLRSNVGPS